MTINITTENGKTKVVTPYNPSFPTRAKKLGGRWQGGAWVFDARDEERVRDLCRDIYGTDGQDSGRKITVRAEYTADHDDTVPDTDLYLGPFQVARVFERDGGARLQPGVVILAGALYSSGSRRSPCLGVREGTVLELRDLPEGMAKAVATEAGSLWRISEAGVEVDYEALLTEATKLRERLAEIETILSWRKAN